jgi:hypothetical protein
MGDKPLSPSAQNWPIFEVLKSETWHPSSTEPWSLPLPFSFGSRYPGCRYPDRAGTHSLAQQNNPASGREAASRGLAIEYSQKVK